MQDPLRKSMSRVLGVVASHADDTELADLLESLKPMLQAYQSTDTRNLEAHLGALGMSRVRKVQRTQSVGGFLPSCSAFPAFSAFFEAECYFHQQQCSGHGCGYMFWLYRPYYKLR